MHRPRGELLLQTTGLTRRADNSERLLLDAVDLEIHGGDRLALMGPSGSGKSLLLRALSRLDPIDAGTILWHGEEVTGDEIPAFRSRVIYLPQRAQLFEGTGESNLQRPYQLQAHLARKYDRAAVLALLAACQRDEQFLWQRAQDLSGGEAQILALVRGLQLQPDLLLLDEPTSALDAATVRQIEALVDRWYFIAPKQRAFVWVTHDAPQAARVSNQLLTIDRGRLDSTASASASPSGGAAL